MNRQKKKPGTFHLQKSNNRWKWMAGATAATAAGVTSSQASIITINLANNYISGFVNHLNADLTGDGHPDLTIANAVAGGGGGGAYATVTLNGVRASCRYIDGPFGSVLNGAMKLGGRSAGYFHYVNTPNSTKTSQHFGTYSLIGSIPIFFKDLHINGGAPTSGSLEVTVDPFTIQLDSFTYTSNTLDHTSSVPDHGSSLALLAMGAGGVLALRRLRAGQERS